MNERTDPHRPSVVDPADYVFVGAADDHPGDSYLEIDHATLAKHGVETGSSDRYSSNNVPFYDAREDGRPNFRCHHCGKHGSNIRYFCFFLHKPSKQVIVVGQICAKKLDLGSREELNFQKRAESFRKMRDRHTWVQDHEAEYEYLREYSEQEAFVSEFLTSLWEQLQDRGSLSEKQLAAVQQNMARRQEIRGRVRFEDGDRKEGVVTRTEAEPTEKQLALIAKLFEQMPDSDGPAPVPSNRIQASNMINKLKTQIHMNEVQENGASEPQISYINRLMEDRAMSQKQRREARQKIDAGLTKAQASKAINWLLELPEIA